MAATRVLALTDDDAGVWVVHTVSSSYVVDMDARTVLRAVGPTSTTMRHDLVPIPLLQLVDVRVGWPMAMVVRIRTDGAVTLRRSTAVTSIVELEA